MVVTAIDRLEQAIKEIYATRDEERTRSVTEAVRDYAERQRGFSIAITHAETALLWLRNTSCRCVGPR